MIKKIVLHNVGVSDQLEMLINKINEIIRVVNGPSGYARFLNFQIRDYLYANAPKGMSGQSSFRDCQCTPELVQVLLEAGNTSEQIFNWGTGQSEKKLTTIIFPKEGE